MHIEQETMEKILVDLGYNLQDNGKYWRSNAVYREGDNKTALIIWKDTGTWKDFVANTKYSGFKKLIQLSGGKNPEKVEEYIKNINNNVELFFDKPKTYKMQFQEFFDSKEVETLLPHYAFYNKKGISDETLRLYSAGLSMSGKMNGRFVFPALDENGKVIGLTGRDLFWKEGSARPKWKKLGKSSQWVYPSFLSPQTGMPFLRALEARQELILVESVGDSLALSQQGLLNNMVIFGLELSSKQLSFIVSQNLKKIYIATNNEDSNRGAIAAVKIFLKLINYIDISKIEIRLPIKKDFGEALETGIPISKWLNKKVTMIGQIDYILGIDKHIIEIAPKQKKLLVSYKEQLNS
jgi:hypothetical protein